jgi:hypothetical protein
LRDRAMGWRCKAVWHVGKRSANDDGDGGAKCEKAEGAECSVKRVTNDSEQWEGNACLERKSVVEQGQLRQAWRAAPRPNRVPPETTD